MRNRHHNGVPAHPVASSPSLTSRAGVGHDTDALRLHVKRRANLMIRVAIVEGRR